MEKAAYVPHGHELQEFCFPWLRCSKIRALVAFEKAVLPVHVVIDSLCDSLENTAPLGVGVALKPCGQVLPSMETPGRSQLRSRNLSSKKSQGSALRIEIGNEHSCARRIRRS